MYYTDYVCFVASVFQTEITVKLFWKGWNFKQEAAGELLSSTTSLRPLSSEFWPCNPNADDDGTFITHFLCVKWVKWKWHHDVTYYCISSTITIRQRVAGLPMISRSNIQLRNILAADLEEGFAVELVRAFEDHKYVDVSIFPDTLYVALTILQAAWRKSSESLQRSGSSVCFFQVLLLNSIL